MAVLWNAAHPGKDVELEATRIAAKTLGVTLLPVAVRGPGDFDDAFAAIGRGRADALIVLSEPLVLAHRQRIVDFSTRARLPVSPGSKKFTEAGALMTYGASLPDLFRHAASFVDKILKGSQRGASALSGRSALTRSAGLSISGFLKRLASSQTHPGIVSSSSEEEHRAKSAKDHAVSVV